MQYFQRKKKIKLLCFVVLFLILDIFGFKELPAYGEDCSLLPVGDAKTQCEKKQQDKQDNLNDKLDNLNDKLKNVQQDVDVSQTKLKQNQVKVITTKTVLQQTEEEIARKEAEIKNLNDRIELNKKILASYLNEIYFTSQEDPVFDLALNSSEFNIVSENSDSLLSLNEKVLGVMDEINISKQQLDQAKGDLAGKQETHKKLLGSQLAEQNVIKTDIQEAQATLEQLNAKIDKLRGELSDLLGMNVSAKDIVDAAKIAGKATGVRKDFILGELVVETDLGRFTGGCYYSKGKNPVSKHMTASNKNAFLKIMKDLGYGVNDRKLSCWPGYGYGGAMGVAQFMPTTWNGYKAYIASATGHNPPNPWNIVDGVMGMAKKLANGGATSKSGEKKAAKIYYCGGPSSPYWKTKCESYAKKVLYWADNYEQKLSD